MKIKKRIFDKKNYLLLKENESITILADCALKSAINIMCKDKKLYVEFLDSEQDLWHGTPDYFQETEKKNDSFSTN